MDFFLKFFLFISLYIRLSNYVCTPHVTVCLCLCVHMFIFKYFFVSLFLHLFACVGVDVNLCKRVVLYRIYHVLDFKNLSILPTFSQKKKRKKRKFV